MTETAATTSSQRKTKKGKFRSKEPSALSHHPAIIDKRPTPQQNETANWRSTVIVKSRQQNREQWRNRDTIQRKNCPRQDRRLTKIRLYNYRWRRLSLQKAYETPYNIVIGDHGQRPAHKYAALERRSRRRRGFNVANGIPPNHCGPHLTPNIVTPAGWAVNNPPRLGGNAGNAPNFFNLIGFTRDSARCNLTGIAALPHYQQQQYPGLLQSHQQTAEVKGGHIISRAFGYYGPDGVQYMRLVLLVSRGVWSVQTKITRHVTSDIQTEDR